MEIDGSYFIVDISLRRTGRHEETIGKSDSINSIIFKYGYTIKIVAFGRKIISFSVEKL